MNDPIVDEVRQIREEQAAQWNFDIDAIFRALKLQEKNGGLVFVNGFAQQRILPPGPQPGIRSASFQEQLASSALEEQSASP